MTGRADVAQQLIEFLKEDTGLELPALDEGTSLREGLGLDSVDFVGIIMRIEGHYRIRLTHCELEKIATVRDLLDLIEVKLADAPPETKVA